MSWWNSALTSGQLFGWIETVGGALKVVLLFGVTVALYDIAKKGKYVVAVCCARPAKFVPRRKGFCIWL